MPANSKFECDLANPMNPFGGDGCSEYCTWEIPAAVWTCTGATGTCTEVCGDGTIMGKLTCDDGNTVSGDGCSNTCGAIELGYHCAS